MPHAPPKLSRRAALAGSAALPPAATLGGTGRARAAAHAGAPALTETHRRFNIGDLEVTSLLAGSRTITDDLQGVFGMNVDKETFTEASKADFTPADTAHLAFKPKLVRSGFELIPFDTGLNGAGIAGVL